MKNFLTKLNKSARRALFIGASLVGFWAIGLFIMNELKENMEYYVTPVQINESFLKESGGKKFRLGGLIESNTIKINSQEKKISFTVMDIDKNYKINVIYDGLTTPPIFKEGVGVICQGNYDAVNKTFYASVLIGKHDEYYSPKSS